jgi:hypothetical protein
VTRPTTTTTTTERTTRAALWSLDEAPSPGREGRRLRELGPTLEGLPVSLPGRPSRSDLTIAAMRLSGLLPAIIAGIVIVVFISMFR